MFLCLFVGRFSNQSGMMLPTKEIIMAGHAARWLSAVVVLSNCCCLRGVRVSWLSEFLSSVSAQRNKK